MSDENNIKYGMGCVPSPVDDRDYIYAPVGGLSVKYPDSFSLEKFPIKNQGVVNSCVAHACALIKEIQEFYETGKKNTFSVGWIYGYRLEDHYKGSGMIPRDALQTLNKCGDVLYEDFKENVEYTKAAALATQREKTCLKKATDYKILSYAQVKDTNSVKHAIYVEKSPVLMCIAVYPNFDSLNYTGIYNTPEGEIEGYHATVIIGFKKINGKDYYICQNSWGDKWGASGRFYLPTNSSIITELWTSIDMTSVKK